MPLKNLLYDIFVPGSFHKNQRKIKSALEISFGEISRREKIIISAVTETCELARIAAYLSPVAFAGYLIMKNN